MAILKKLAKKVKKEDVKPAQPKAINLGQLVKQAIVQVKYEEMGSWLITHRTPLFYAHKKGLTVVDQKFIDARPWLKRALNKLVKEVEESKAEKAKPKEEPKTQRMEYIG